MGRGNGLGDTQSQTGSSPSLRPGFGSPVKTVKYLLLLSSVKPIPVSEVPMGPVAVTAKDSVTCRPPGCANGVTIRFTSSSGSAPVPDEAFH
jgi:hypothetical protein